MLNTILLFFTLSFLFFTFFLKWLKKTKAYQPIYELSPDSHQAKGRTPSFGGVGILLSLSIGMVLFDISDPRAWWCYSLFIAFAILGFCDDYIAIKRSKNMGLSAKQKFLAQSVTAFILLFIFNLKIEPLSLVEILFYAFVIVGSSNATNLTDGLDGLLSGLSSLTLLGFILYFMQLYYIEMVTLSTVLLFSVLVFFWFNRNPAKIFMGDTGSLALGACFASLSIIAKNPWVLLPLGAVYILETMSVIIQVAVYKKTKKRVFLMAPLHHHFELLGLTERQVVSLFWLKGFLFLLFFAYQLGVL